MNIKSFYNPNTASIVTITMRMFVLGWTNWKGRTTRREFWLGGIGLILPYVLLRYMQTLTISQTDSLFKVAIDVDLFTPATWLLEIIIICVCTVPALGAAVRRLHDINAGGWWLILFIGGSLLPYVGGLFEFWALVWFCLDSEKTTNEWGESPKYANHNLHK